MGLSPGSSESPSSPGGTFKTATVFEYISNPVEFLQADSLYDDGQTNEFSLSEGALKCSNNAFSLSLTPRNSIVGEVSKGQKEIFYPFFSSHLCLPVKPGEKVWVFHESSGADGPSQGYWLSRKMSTIFSSGLNYTHIERNKTLKDLLDTSGGAASGGTQVGSVAPAGSDGETGENKDVENLFPYSFPSGGGTEDASNTIQGGTDGFNILVEKSEAYQNQFTGEIVPRFSKRSPDLVLQGSNNTLICLGEDRGRNSAKENGGLVTITDSLGKGTIDLVAGRSVTQDDGSLIFDLNDTISDSDVVEALGIDFNETTLPAAIAKNTREYVELDKSVLAKKDDKQDSSKITTDNPAEGDPDFINDLSRVYVSMKTSGDSNLGLAFTNSSAPEVADVPYVIAKSTEVRLVARDGGSVRMVKEGDEQCEISLMSDGTISIEGGIIYLGENDAGNTTQPVVQGTLLLTAVTNFCTSLQAAVASSVGNLGVPVQMPALAAACTTFTTEVGAALSTMVYTK
jgi:hypothetical protein